MCLSVSRYSIKAVVRLLSCALSCVSVTGSFVFGVFVFDCVCWWLCCNMQTVRFMHTSAFNPSHIPPPLFCYFGGDFFISLFPPSSIVPLFPFFSFSPCGFLKVVQPQQSKDGSDLKLSFLTCTHTPTHTLLIGHHREVHERHKCAQHTQWHNANTHSLHFGF